MRRTSTKRSRPPGTRHSTALSSTAAVRAETCVQLAAQLDRPIGQLEILHRPAEVSDAHGRTAGAPRRWPSPASRRASSTICAEPPMSNAASRRVLGRAPVRCSRGASPADHPRRARASLGVSTLRNTRRLRSTGVNTSVCVISISDLPSISTPSLSSAKWKRPQDLGLRLGGEVHERVAAHEQVDARDRRVLHEVVAAEDHAAPQVLAEHVALVGPLEEALERIVAARPRSGAADRRPAAPDPEPPRRRRSRRS